MRRTAILTTIALCALLGQGCYPTMVDCTREEAHTVNNMTGKRFVYHVSVNYDLLGEGSFSYADKSAARVRKVMYSSRLYYQELFYTISPQAEGCTFSYKVEAEPLKGGSCSGLLPGEYLSVMLYNIDDTSKISFRQRAVGHVVTDSPYMQVSADKGDGGVTYRYTLTIRDRLVSAMQKDTAMLRMFPEHYR